MTRTRILTLCAALVAVAGAVLLGGALRSGSSEAAPASPAGAGLRFADGFGLDRDTSATVLRLQEAVRRDPKDAHSLTLLGLAYQQRARETADPSWYPRAERALRSAASLTPSDPLAATGLATLAASRHRFRDALALARRARALAPELAAAHGVVGDALAELGRYRDAFRAYDTQARLRPSVSAYARVAAARELRGDVAGALTAMRLAVDAATGEREPLAWTHVELGKIHFRAGRAQLAAREFRTALAVLPEYVPALDSLALAEAALGHLPRAIALERRVVTTVPSLASVTQLADMLRTAGDETGARRQEALVRAIAGLLRANGVRTDLELALFEADRGRPARAVVLARAARRERPSIDGDDVLAWALARNNRCGEALVYSKRALRLGTRDALKLFHRGMIERCLGREDAANAYLTRALATNPHFSLRWAPVARQTLG